MPLGVSQDPPDLDLDNLAWLWCSFIYIHFTQYNQKKYHTTPKEKKQWDWPYKRPYVNTDSKQLLQHLFSKKHQIRPLVSNLFSL